MGYTKIIEKGICVGIWVEKIKKLFFGSGNTIQKVKLKDYNFNPDIDDFRHKTILRAEEAYKYDAIDGLQYDARGCDFSECHALHKKIFTIEEAKKIKFKSDCGCSLLPFKRSWEKELPEYIEPIEKKRARIKKEYEIYFHKKDLASLIKLESLYKQALEWHWAEFRNYSESLISVGDFERALTWINTAINSRIVQLSKDPKPLQYDSSLASLYVIRGSIFLRKMDYQIALHTFLTALWQYEWKPTKTLTLKINSTLKKTGLSEQKFIKITETAKAEGIDVGLERLKIYLYKKEGEDG